MIIELSLEKNVFFLGHKEHSELPFYFQQADLFTLPSDKETFGMVMIEAMACGTPVAGMNCPGGPTDVITHGLNGILTTPAKYSEEILNYFKNKDRQKNISEQARIKAVNEYSIEATTKVLKTSKNFSSFAKFFVKVLSLVAEITLNLTSLSFSKNFFKSSKLIFLSKSI